MTGRPCNARRPAGVERCTEAFGHARGPRRTKHYDGAHSWGEEWGETSAPRSSLPPGKKPNRSSEKQEIRTAFLMGVKAERLRAQIDQRGEPFCQECNRLLSPDLYGSPEYDGDAEYVEACMAMLDLHHKVERTKGHGYRGPSAHGVDSPCGLVLLCRPCHQKQGSDPQWTPRVVGGAP